MRIAIVGSGIAGLSAAWLLGRRHKVTLFERHGRPGMGAFNLDYPLQGSTVRIDVPIRAFNHCHYRQLVKFYEVLGVEMLRTDHAAAYSSPGAVHPYFAYKYLDLEKYSIPYPYAAGRFSIDSLRILRDTLRFLLTAKKDRLQGVTSGLGLAAYLSLKGYSSAFAEGVLIPSFAAICTCSYDAVRAYPAEAIIDFLASGMLFNGIWRAREGADDAIGRLLQHCRLVQCNTTITTVQVHSPGPTCQAVVALRDSEGGHYEFDQVILAVQANQAVAMLGDQDPLAVDCLRAVAYQRSEVVVHGDPALAPGHATTGPAVLFEVDRNRQAPMASICLNKLYPSLREAPPLFQTWNPLREPAAGKVLGRAHFERPVLTTDSLARLAELDRLLDAEGRRVWYCGSYAKPGIPLLESALQSAMDIARRLGADIPWSG